jgi:predicted PurR-regulated permease PerM
MLKVDEPVGYLSTQVEEGAMSEAPVSRPWSTVVKVVVVVFGVLGLGAVVLRFQDVIAPLVIACLVAYVLIPIINLIAARTRLPRGLVTAAIYLLSFGLVVLAVSLLAPLLLRQALSFQLDFQRIGGYIEALFSEPLHLGNLAVDLAQVYDELIAALSDLVRPLATQTMAVLAGVVSIAIELVFTIIVSFYLIKDGPHMVQWVVRWVPPHLRHDFERLRQELDALWRAFFRGQLLLALTMGMTVGGLMAILGMKNALILGLLAFFLEFLPSIGHGIWLVIAVPLALFQGSLWIPISNLGFALIVLGVHLVLQQVDLNFFIPRIVGRHVRLHPMVVIIGIIGGGLLAGVLGVLLAAPTIASAGVLARYVYCKLLDMDPWSVDLHAQEEEQKALSRSQANGGGDGGKDTG